MKRFLTILNWSATSSSILLAAATITLWIRSCYVHDAIYYVVPGVSLGGEHEYYLFSNTGRFGLQELSLDDITLPPGVMYMPEEPPRPYWSTMHITPLTKMSHSDWRFFALGLLPGSPGFQCVGFTVDLTTNDTRIAIPYYAILLITSLFPLHFFHRLMKRQRPLPTSCPKCSYDLRAHNPGDNCPECGTPIPAKNPK